MWGVWGWMCMYMSVTVCMEVRSQLARLDSNLPICEFQNETWIAWFSILTNHLASPANVLYF